MTLYCEANCYGDQITDARFVTMICDNERSRGTGLIGKDGWRKLMCKHLKLRVDCTSILK